MTSAASALALMLLGAADHLGTAPNWGPAGLRSNQGALRGNTWSPTVGVRARALHHGITEMRSWHHSAVVPSFTALFDEFHLFQKNFDFIASPELI